MWSPLDKSALPSLEEISHAKEAIITLENALRDAFELIESTKLRIAAMERDLDERKGWIAPIRKVPSEILIDILLWASEMSDLAPINFVAVCRLWRNIILATPKAWSFIDLIGNYREHVYFRENNEYHDYFPGYKNTYFERSKPMLSHLALPKSEGFYTKHSNSIIKEQAHRLQCLTTHVNILSDTQFANRCQQFPHLKTLNLMDGGVGDKLDTSFFNISRFPALRTLRWPRCYPLTAVSGAISPSNFPPLQHLSVEVGSVPSCMDILQSCAATLKTLHISQDKGHATTSPFRIDFPLLQFLTIGQYYLEGSLPLIAAATPVLTSLVVGGWVIPTFFEADLHEVAHIRVDSFKILPSCHSVRVLQVLVSPRFVASRPGGHEAFAKELKLITGQHPSLEIIELSSKGQWEVCTMQQKVEECLGERGQKPELLWTDRWRINLPGHEPETSSAAGGCLVPCLTEICKSREAFYSLYAPTCLNAPVSGHLRVTFSENSQQKS